MARLVSSLLLASLLSARAQQVELNVDWATYLSRADLLYSWATNGSTPSEWTQSIWGGNGGLGFMLFTPDSPGSLSAWVGRSDVYDDRSISLCPNPPTFCPAFQGNFAIDTPRLPIGVMNFTCRGAITAVSARTSVYDGMSVMTVTSDLGVMRVNMWGNKDWATADVLVFESTTLSGSDVMNVTFTPSAAVSSWAGDGQYPYVYSPPVACTPDASGATLCTQVHLMGTAHSSASLTVSNASTGAVVTYLSVSPVMATATDSDSYARNAVTVAAGLTAATLANSTAAWWRAFWEGGSAIMLDDSVFESFYYVQLFKFACATDAGRSVHDLNGPWLPPPTNWPDLHWDMNLQQTYYMTLPTGRFDLASTLVDFMQSAAAGFASNPPAAWRNDSSAAPTGASALTALETCYWNNGPDCTTSPPSVTANLLWALHLLTMTAEYTQNATILTEVVWPILTRALNFYLHFQVNDSGIINLPDTYSPEWPGGSGPNANYDLALYAFGLNLALALAQTYNLTAPNLPQYASTAAALHGLNVDPATGLMIYSNTPYDQPHRHYSHLFGMWPLRTLMGNSSNLPLAALSLDTYTATPEKDSLFYRPAVTAMNVMLGRHGAAFSNLTFLIVGSGRIEENTFYREGPYGSCTETPYAAAWALTDILLGSWNASVLHFFPGVADVLNLTNADDFLVAGAARASFYSIRAAGGYNTSAARVVISSNATTLVTAPSWIAVTAMPGPAAYAAAGGGPVTLRSTLTPPLAIDPPSLSFTVLQHDMVRIDFLPSNATAVLYSAASPPAGYVVTPTPGCPADFNWWGYQPSRGAAGSFTKVQLANCSSSLAASQQFAFNSNTGQFVLQDGNNNLCLTPQTCGTGSGTLLGVSPCVSSSTQQPGCHGAASQCGVAQQWTLVPGPTGTQICAASAPSQCMDINGAVNNIVDLWGPCAPTPCGEGNQQFVVNSTSLTITSLDDAPGAHFYGACLTVV